MSADTYLPRAFAQALLDPSITIIIGQCRADTFERLRRKKIAVPLDRFGLQPVFYVETLKGARDFPEVIFVHGAPSFPTSGSDPRQLADFLADDGMRILALVSLTKFQTQPKRPPADPRWKELPEDIKSIAPAELFQRLKYDYALNPRTLFTVEPAGLVRRINLPEKTFAAVADQTPEEKLRADRWKQALASLPAKTKLSGQFKDDLQDLIRLVPIQIHESRTQSRQRYREFLNSETRARLKTSLRTEMGQRVLEALENDIAEN